jgi:hypothetical protein
LGQVSVMLLAPKVAYHSVLFTTVFTLFPPAFS